ncbi:S8 family serine peptidase [Myroides odoratimimus]|uniref:S8 family serine peptidase n=1 Tax=Myroides odoratimimus TaxID=76832 RepID=UPI001CE1121F|nr:S8 family serine peptidase [Myroides odoratimimus]MCA4806968.1 S8 family serine peptidase [Myroides odoratimimus]
MKVKYLSILVSALLLSGCSYDDQAKNTDGELTEQYQPKGIEGMMTIKLQPEILQAIDNTKNELAIPTGIASLDHYLESIGAYKMKRVFPFAGKHEQMQVNENLNAWYTVWHEHAKMTPSLRSDTKKNNSDIIAYTEPVYEPRLESHSISPIANVQASKSSVSFFNDPLFSKQWNLLNLGTIGNYQNGDEHIISSIPGADINIIPAWQQETGSADVIVSIVDGGVDIHHEDLIDNLWINEGEIPGNGIDDDNNGYVDDVYGFNFVDETGDIEAHDHGTHVAGVIAAKNDNGIGISSIAGGNGKVKSGVRIMSSQIFKNNPNHNPKDPDSRPNLSVKSSNHTAAAIVYGANNGAVISQNSWGYDVGIKTPRVVKEAIDYFNKYAGHSGKSKSLMQGGIVIFAASNDNTEYKTYPAAEPDVIAVAAYAPDFSATWYTNYGNWVDIAAPGGSSRIGKKYPHLGGEMTSAILSTISSSKGQSRYGYMQGTSMAAPHVSGIASLIISKYGNPGYTREELKQRLLTSVKVLNANNFNTPTYADKLGKGFIDASAALSEYDSSALPTRPVFVDHAITTGYSSIKLAWQPELPASGKNTNIESYILYMSEREITESNYKDDSVKQLEIPASFSQAESVLERTMTNLKSGTTYYFAIKSFARSGKSSDLIIYKGGIATLLNRAPVITSNVDTSRYLEIAGNDVLEILFTVNDPENHTWDYEVSNSAQNYHHRSGNQVVVRIFANKYYKGNHSVTLTVKDQYGAQSGTRVDFLKKEKNPPRLKDQNKTFNIPYNDKQSFDLRQMMIDDNLKDLKFRIKSVANNNITASLNNAELLVTGNGIGASSISIVAVDNHAQELEFTIPVFVYKNQGIYSLYPTVATTKVYVKVGEVVKGEVRLRIRDVMGRQVKQESFNTSELDPVKQTYLVDIHSLSPGKYELSIMHNGTTSKEYFVKE